jgi:hypothetical protein
MIFTKDDLFITSIRELNSKNTKTKNGLKKRRESFSLRKRLRGLIGVRIIDYGRGKYRYLVEADCNNGQFFNKVSAERLHQFLVKEQGENYELKTHIRKSGLICSSIFVREDGTPCDISSDYCYRYFCDLESALKFAIELNYAAVWQWPSSADIYGRGDEITARQRALCELQDNQSEVN